MNNVKKRVVELIIDPSSSEEFQTQTKPRTNNIEHIQEQTQTKARTLQVVSSEQANTEKAKNSQVKEKTSKTEKSSS